MKNLSKEFEGTVSFTFVVVIVPTAVFVLTTLLHGKGYAGVSSPAFLVLLCSGIFLLTHLFSFKEKISEFLLHHEQLQEKYEAVLGTINKESYCTSLIRDAKYLQELFAEEQDLQRLANGLDGDATSLEQSERLEFLKGEIERSKKQFWLAYEAGEEIFDFDFLRLIEKPTITSVAALGER